MNSLLLGIYAAPIGIMDFLLGLLFVILILILSSSKKSKMLLITGNGHYKYYMYNIYFKLLFAIIYGAIYKYYYQGGDTMAYWFGAEALNNLFWYSPVDYWNELLMIPSQENIILHFNSTTGYPPGWIYRDPNSFFVSKIFSVFMLFFGKSYLVLTMVLSVIMAKASWKVYELVLHYKITTDWMAALAGLFIPSVSFWCAGLSKDTVVLITVFLIVHYVFGIANKTLKSNLWGVIATIALLFILLHVRSFMAYTVAVPLFLAFSTRIVKKYQESPFIANLVKFFILSFSVISFLMILSVQGDEIVEISGQYITEAKVQQNDFQNNAIYGVKKYDLGITDFSPLGMAKAAPLAVLTAFYRPGIWEARSPLLLISGLETTIFIYLTFYFFLKGSFLRKIKTIQNNELLMFSLAFAILLGFFAGFTSVLFGVLVRIKAPLLPFLLMILTVIPKKKDETLDKQVHLQ